HRGLAEPSRAACSKMPSTQELRRTSPLMKMKRTITTGRIWIVCALLTAALVVFAANAGRLLVVDAPKPSDVILVLAGETDHRPARAVELLDQGYGRLVVIDVPADSRVFGFTQIQLAEKY